MFKKPKRNFRSRNLNKSENEDADDCGNAEKKENEDCRIVDMDMETEEEPTVIIKRAKDKKKKDKAEKGEKVTNSVLSFGDDLDSADGEVFKIKKSSSSRRIAKELRREQRELEKEKVDVESSNVPQQWSEEHNAPPFDATSNGQSQTHPLTSVNILDTEAVQDPDGDVEVADGQHTFQAVLAGGVIPDANLIHLARKQRQLARQQGDFIPLEEGRPAPEKASTKGGSRLVREEDHDLSDEDGDGVKLGMAGGISKLTERESELRDIQTRILQAQEDDEGEEATWEETQIQKGVNMPQVQLAPQFQCETAYQQYMYSQSANIFNPSAGAMYNPQVCAAAPSSIAAGKPASEITIASLKKALQDRVCSLEEVHSAHERERESLASRLESCHETVEKCQEDRPDLEKRSQFFQEVHSYTRDLTDCLNEKLPQIEFLERCMMTLLRQRAERLTSRRQQDVKDQAADYTASKLVVIGTPLSAADPERQRRAAEREARRARRRRAREAASVREHDEGLSTDDEENNSETMKFTAERDRLAADSATIFQDVIEDFHDLRLIRARFEAWKADYGDSYSEAYIGMCLHKLFAPFVKLRLICWNPVSAKDQDATQMDWFQHLLYFGFDEDRPPATDDSDIKLLPSLVEKVLLPKLTGLVEAVYDPLSARQTAWLAAVVTQCGTLLPSVHTQSKNTQALMRALVTRIRKCLDDDVFVPLYPRTMLEDRRSEQHRFHQRQFWSCLKLVRSITAWHDVLADDLLQELSLNCLVNRYVVLALLNMPANQAALRKCQLLVAALPAAWFASLSGDTTLPQLENVCRLVMSAAGSIDAVAEKQKHLDPNKRTSRELIQQFGKLLLKINAKDHAKKMSDLYFVKITT